MERYQELLDILRRETKPAVSICRSPGQRDIWPGQAFVKSRFPAVTAEKDR